MHLVERKAAGAAQRRAVANLNVADALPRRVFHHLVGDPLQRIRRLQQRHGDIKAAEVVLEAARIIHEHEAAKCFGIGGGELHLGGARELQHRLGPERSVEMHVQLRLGQARDQLAREHRVMLGHPVT